MSDLREHVIRITNPVYDAVCNTKLTNGQTLLVLKKAKAVIDEQIADLEETVERQTKLPEQPGA